MHNAVFSLLVALVTTVFAALASAEVPTKAEDEASDIARSADCGVEGEETASADASLAATNDDAPVDRL